MFINNEVKNMKLVIPRVKTFCCFTSVRMGTMLITYITQFMSFVSFVWWASNVYLMYRRALLSRDEEADNSHVTLAWVHVSLGMVAVVLNFSLGCILWAGMSKDNYRYFELYLVLGIISILLNIVMTAIGAQIIMFTLAYPLVFGIPFQLYFLLVIRSTVKEMVDEQGGIPPGHQEQYNEESLQNEPV